MPRSGHGFLHRIITGYFGRELLFCDVYAKEACCGALPCARLEGHHRVFHQKNHDFDLRLDPHLTLPGLLYVVQYRHPLPHVVSHREWAARTARQRGEPERTETREGYARWLAHRAFWLRGFTRKWLAPAREDVVKLRYEDLTANPVAAIGALIRRSLGSVDESRLAAAVARQRERGHNEAYRPRVLADSPYFDAELLAAFEGIVLADCEGLAYEPMLPGAPADNPVAAAYRRLVREAA